MTTSEAEKETKYVVMCWADKYSGWWHIIRVQDRRIIHSNPSVFTCCQWVKSWGDTDWIKSRKGTPLSPNCDIRR